jgi:hypothetical protein
MRNPPAPLSPRERSALHRILAASSRGRLDLEPRQRAALDAYAEILSTPPIEEAEVVVAARAVIRVWAEGESRPKAQPRRRTYIPAILLDPTPAPVVPALPFTPIAPETPFLDLARDLADLGIVEASTEVVHAYSPLYDLADRATEVVTFRTLDSTSRGRRA